MNREQNLFRCLLLLLICSSWSVSGQMLAASGKAGSASKSEWKPLRLEDALGELEKRYEVSFFYKTNLLEGLQVDENNRPRFDNLKRDLNKLLRQHDLRYEKTDGNLYVIIGDRGDETPAVTLELSREVIPGPANSRQQTIVTGRVTSATDSMPLPGVSVLVKGTQNGTSTDMEGRFELQNVSGEATLVFSLLGFITVEQPVSGQQQVNISLEPDQQSLEQVVVTGYGTQKRGSLTGAISTITSSDLERVHGGATVSSSLAGKIPGVTFRMADGRPGASANIQIRNMGNPLFVIDGIQQDAGQFNNLAPNDIESITVLKDASAAIYGVRAANGVVVVTTKRGKLGARNTINVDAYTGWQNWSRFPETVNAYEWQVGVTEADLNRVNPGTNMTPEELEKWKQGTEYGYRNFDWYDFIIKENSPMTSINVNATGGSERINYYLSATRLDQNSVLGREFTFGRTNIQSNLDAKISERIKVGVQINGRIETRDNPGVPGVDDYWAPRFALFRNRPYERPYANDNPEYLNDIGHNAENWGLLNKEMSGYWTSNWRVLQTNFNAEYEVPGIEGLTASGKYSYYLADHLMNGHEYTYEAYTYYPETDEYKVTGGSINPWREREQKKVFNNMLQGQLTYNNTFGKHTFGGIFAAERYEHRELRNWVHSVPKSNSLSLIYFTDQDTYDDSEIEEARTGYIGRFNYNYDNKYYLEVSARRDASWKFAPGKRVGFFPSASVGWRITAEPFMQELLGENSILYDLKLRASYGKLGDDDIGIDPFDYLGGYTYSSGTGRAILDGVMVVGARDRGVPITNITWFTSTIADIGADFSLLEGRLTGTLDYFYRKREGLRGRKYDVLVPSELGYALPDENVNSDAQIGGEGSLFYSGESGDFGYTVGGNLSFSRSRFLESYKPIFNNSWDHYRNSSEDRWSNIYWGYEVIGQFQSQEEINNYPVNIDNEGNKTLLPGDLIYKDVNEDGKINEMDERPIGYAANRNPNVNFGFSISLTWKGLDFTADFSGGSMYTFGRNYEMKWPFQNGGNLLRQFYDDRWHREDLFDLNSAWIPGKYPTLRFNDSGHSNYNKNSTFWTTNVRYLRARTIELGYSLPKAWLDKVKLQRARIYVNGYNLFSFDNMKDVGVDPEIIDPNGLQFPPNKFVNVGVNLSL